MMDYIVFTFVPRAVKTIFKKMSDEKCEVSGLVSKVDEPVIKELSDTESVSVPRTDLKGSVVPCSPTPSENESVKNQISGFKKVSGLKTPMKVTRLCDLTLPKPAVPLPAQTCEIIRKLSEETGRKKLTDVEEGDESSEGTTSNSVSPSPYSYRRPSRHDRKSSNASVVLTEDTDSFIIGEHVWVGGTKPGQIAYIGETQFAPGEWAGIVLDEPIGKNDGSVGGIRYFQCESKRGVFSRLTRLTRYPLQTTSPVSPAESQMSKSLKSPVTSTPVGPRRSVVSPTGSAKSLSQSKHLNTSNSSLASIPHCDLKIGERVIVRSSATTGSKPGILRYVGYTQFAPGEWCGVELDDPTGKNDGSVDGVRYFECQPFYGVFVSSAKISKSPSKHKPSSCAVHRGPGSTSGLRRSNSRESMNSMTSSLASSVRTTSSRIRHGISSLNPSITASSATKYRSTPASSTIQTKAALQDALREKDVQVTKLLRERELERAEVTRAASQADHAEQLLAALTKDYEKYRIECQEKIKEKDGELICLRSDKDQLLTQLEEEKRRAEDLQFKFEEAAINEGDVEQTNSTYLNRIKDLETSLAEERKRVELLEQDSNKLFESEEALSKAREELDHLQQELQSQNINAANEKIADLTSQVEKYKTELNQKNDDSYKQNQETQNEIESIRKKLNDIEKKYEKSLSTISEQQDQIQHLSSKVEAAHHELELKTKDICENAKANENKLAKELENIKREMSVKVLDLESNTEELKNKTQRITELEVQVKALEHEMTLKDDHIDNHIRSKREAEAQFQLSLQEVQDRLNEANSEYNEHKVKTAKELLAAQTALENQKMEASGQQAQITRLQYEISSQQTAVAESAVSQIQMQSEMIVQKDQKIMALNREFEAKCDELAECHDSNTKNVLEIHQLTAQVETYKRDFEVLYQKLTEEEKVNCNLTAKINSMELEIGDLVRKLSAADKTVAIITEQKESIEIELRNVMKANSNSDSKVGMLTDQNAQLSQQLEECKANLVSKQLSWERAQEELQQTIRQLRLEIEQNRNKHEQVLQDANSDKSRCDTELKELSLKAKQRETELQNEILRLNQVFKSRSEEYEREIQQCKLDKSAFSDQLQQQRAELEKNKAYCGEMEASLKKDILNLQQNLKVKSEFIIELESKCQQMQNEYQQKNNDLDQRYSMDMKTCREKIADLEQNKIEREEYANQCRLEINNYAKNQKVFEGKLKDQDQTIINLRGELSRCASEAEKYEHQLSLQAEECKKTSMQMEQVVMERESCQKALFAANKQVEEINLKCSQTQEEMAILSRQCADQKQQNNALEKLKDQYEQEKNAILAHCQEKDNRLKQLVYDMEQIKEQKCTKCELELNRYQENLERLTKSCTDKENQLHIISQEISNAKLQCEQFKNEGEMWKDKYEQVKTEIYNVHNQCQEKENQMMQLRENHEKALNDKDRDTTNRVQGLEYQINQYLTQMKTIEKQCQEKDREIIHWRDSCKDIQEKVCQEAQKINVEYVEECNTIKYELQKEKERCKASEQQIVVLTQDLNNAKHKCEDAERNYISINSQCREAENKIGVLEREIAYLKQKPEKVCDTPVESDTVECKKEIVYVPQSCPETQVPVAPVCENQIVYVPQPCQEYPQSESLVCEKEMVYVPQPCPTQESIPPTVIAGDCSRQLNQIYLLQQELSEARNLTPENLQMICSPLIQQEIRQIGSQHQMPDNRIALIVEQINSRNLIIQKLQQEIDRLRMQPPCEPTKPEPRPVEDVPETNPALENQFKAIIIDLQNKIKNLENQNMELSVKVAAGCQDVGITVQSENLDRLELLEQIEELKCELEERSKELVLCKSRIPCLASKANEKLLLGAIRKGKIMSDSMGLVTGSGVSAGALSDGAAWSSSGSAGGYGKFAASSAAGSFEELALAQSQIQFLNSIIVDMQNKNKELILKVEALEASGCSSLSSNALDKFLKPRVQAPRMFCDICDEFDLHETEDCPTQGSDTPPNEAAQPLHRPSNEESAERPYCEICEVFGHSTEDCDDTETF